MKVAIHQPQYLPWLGYFDKMDQSDVFVLLDDVQYKKNEWQNRNKVRNTKNWHWLTVPVLFKFKQKVNEVKINNKQNWREKHLKSIKLNYSRAPYFEKYISFFRESYLKEWEYLVDLNLHFIHYLKDALEIKAELVRSSALNVKGKKTERLIGICRHLGADTYLSGAGAKDYLDEEQFKKSGITLKFQNYTHPEYLQTYDGFEPYMSVIDLLFCHGRDSLNIIKEGRKR
ncbi:MAG: WbqC family protein [Candidatus Omnitrophota bacterium]